MATSRSMGSPFGAISTTDEVLSGINLHGKRILVTGVSAGLGIETAAALSAAPRRAHVVGAARDLVKADAATAQVAKRRLGKRRPLRAGWNLIWPVSKASAPAPIYCWRKENPLM